MKQTMLACLLKGPGNVLLEQLPVPSIEDDEVLVEMKTCGICGTDLEKISGELDAYGILGHEPAGIVSSTGSRVKTVKVGDRVVVHHHVPCYNCNFCGTGDYTMCKSFKQTNIQPCGLAEFFKIPYFNTLRGAILPLPENVTFEEGALIEPTACCIRALHKAKVKPADNVVVFGLGPTGLTQIQLLRNMTKSKIVGLDLMESRRKAAAMFGTDAEYDPTTQDFQSDFQKFMHNTSPDVVIVSTGNPKAVMQGLKMVRKGGRLLLFGAPGIGSSMNLDLSQLFASQIQILTSYSCLEAEMETAIKLVSNNVIDLKSLITHKFSLNEVQSGLRFAKSSRDAIKTIIFN